MIGTDGGPMGKKRPPPSLGSRDRHNIPPGAGSQQQPQQVQPSDPVDDGTATDRLAPGTDKPGPSPRRLAVVGIVGVLLGMLLMGGLWFVVGSGDDRSTAQGQPAGTQAARSPQVAGTQ